MIVRKIACGAGEDPIIIEHDREKGEAQLFRSGVGLYIAAHHIGEVIRTLLSIKDMNASSERKTLALGACPGCGNGDTDNFVYCVKCRRRDKLRKRKLRMSVDNGRLPITKARASNRRRGVTQSKGVKNSDRVKR